MSTVHTVTNQSMAKEAATVDNKCLMKERAARRNYIRKIMTDLGAGSSSGRDEEIRRIWREAEQAGR